MELSAREKYDGSLLIWMEIELTFHAHQGVRDYLLHKHAIESRNAGYVYLCMHLWYFQQPEHEEKKARDWYQDLLEVRGQRCYGNGRSKNISSLSSLPRKGKKYNFTTRKIKKISTWKLRTKQWKTCQSDWSTKFFHYVFYIVIWIEYSNIKRSGKTPSDLTMIQFILRSTSN